MNKFKLLGILTILVIIGDFSFSAMDNWDDFRDGFIEGYNNGQADKNFNTATETVTVKVKALQMAQDSLVNRALKGKVPYRIEEIQVPFVPAPRSYIFSIIELIFAFALIYGTYSLIRMLISISHRRVFISKNVVRMRFFTYSFVLFVILSSLIEWLNNMEIIKQIEMPGYEVFGVKTVVSWTLLVIIILFTEIFAVGVKIKEEQDLTI